MNAAVIYPHVPDQPSGATLRVGMLVEFLRTRVDRLEVFLPDARPEETNGNVRYVYEPYDLSPATPWLNFAPAGDPDASLDTALHDLTHQLRLLAMHKSPNDLQLLGISGPGMEMLWSFFRIFNNRTILAKLREMIARADIVFIEYPYWARWIIPLCRAAGATTVLTNYDVLAVTCPDKNAVGACIWEMEKAALLMADHACVVSPNDAAFFAKAKVPVEAIINPIDCRKGNSPIAPKIGAALRQKYGLPEGPLAFFVGGSWFLNRDAVAAIAAMAPQVPECTFVIAGACALPGRQGNVISLGILNDRELQAMYHLATLILVPLAGGTGSSLKFIEAMSYGKAIVSTAAGIRGYPVTHDREVVMLDDIAELPLRVRELLADAPRRERLEQAAKEFAQRYHFENIFEPYSRWIEERRAAGSLKPA